MASMSAAELLQHMQAGGVVRRRRKRSVLMFGIQKLRCRLRMPSNEVLTVQQSAVAALVGTGAIQCFPWQNGEADYFIPGISKPGKYFA